ncbi:MAG: cytochrome b/b6 domain-containing protein [Magnetococcales bacterium]|nr:cytochrome b/b6 domain-containing protein [Magnetococcales bacterium]
MDSVKVWDLPTRIFHWSLAVLVLFAALSGDDSPEWWLGLHIIAGYAIFALLIWRLVWGFFGPGPSRFGDFVRPPREIVDHLKATLARRGKPWLGHNPAGGAMIVALLITLLLIVVSGVITLGGEENQGVAAAWVPFAVGKAAKEVHEFLVGLLGLLVVGHVGGVILESLLHRENLIRSMIHGRRLAVPEAHPLHPAPARPLSAVLALAALLGGLWWVGSALSAVPSAKIPAHYALDPVYREACGECHWAFHPSLLSRSGWEHLMANLSDHYGENAALPPDKAAVAGAFLQAHAAEAWDTEPARKLNRDGSGLRLTQTPYFRKKHRELNEAAWHHAEVGSPANCPACHLDAESGRFDDQAIRLPKGIQS